MTSPDGYAHQATFEAHALQRHIGRLAVAVCAWVSVSREYKLSMAAIGFDRLQQSKCVLGQRYGVWASLFHAFGRDRPDLPFEVDVSPASCSGFRRARHGVKLPFD